MMHCPKVLDIEESLLNKWDSDIKRRIAGGENILQFNLGQPDFACPGFVKEAIEAANGKERNNFYIHTGGTDEARQAVADMARKLSGFEYGKDEIIITNGAKEALFLSLAAVLGKGDEAIVIAPHWPTYIQQIKFLGAAPVVVASEEDFALDLKKIKAAISGKTRAIILNNPNNPTGRVYKEQDLEEVVSLAKEYGFFIISDEVYNSTVFDGKRHISVASFPDAKERSAIIDGFSKTLSVAGYRLGFAMAPGEIINLMIRVKSNINGNTSSFFQTVLEDILVNRFEDLMEFIAMTRREYLQRRDFVSARLGEMGLEHRKPEGAFYAFVKIPEGLGMGSREFAAYLLDKAGVAVAPGIFFGENYDGYFRLSFASRAEDLQEGMERIEKMMSEK
jgi:aminotransferase